MTETTSTPAGVAAGRVDRAPMPGPEHERLNAITGRWINEGHTINPDGTPGVNGRHPEKGRIGLLRRNRRGAARRRGVQA
jgi:hypothetical protein